MEWSSSESKPSLGQKKGKLIYHSTLLRVFMITRKFNFFFAAVVALLFWGGGGERAHFLELLHTPSTNRFIKENRLTQVP